MLWAKLGLQRSTLRSKRTCVGISKSPSPKNLTLPYTWLSLNLIMTIISWGLRLPTNSFITVWQKLKSVRMHYCNQIICHLEIIFQFLAPCVRIYNSLWIFDRQSKFLGFRFQSVEKSLKFEQNKGLKKVEHFIPHFLAAPKTKVWNATLLFFDNQTNINSTINSRA